MRHLAMVLCFSIYMAGVVIAEGFWWTVLAIFVPFYAWYLTIEKILIVNGLIG